MRGRFAPSPSGAMHLGNAWTALLAWLQVRSAGGTMVLRMEDLDPDRSKKQYADQLILDLSWLGLDWDEGEDRGGPFEPYSQDLRRDLYNQAVIRLTEMGLVYPCYCTRAEIRGSSLAPHGIELGMEYPGLCAGLTSEERRIKEQAGRLPALRIRVPEREINFVDLCHGVVHQNLRAVGDFVLQRADGVHAYQLAVVVDDGLMNISHVLRGDDLLLSTPRQIWLYELLELTVPQFAHVPLLYGPDGYRLSKRHGSWAIAELREKGVKAETIIGFLAFQAGLIHKQEAVKPTDLIRGFSLAKVKAKPVNLTQEVLSNL